MKKQIVKLDDWVAMRFDGKAINCAFCTVSLTADQLSKDHLVFDLKSFAKCDSDTASQMIKGVCIGPTSGLPQVQRATAILRELDLERLSARHDEGFPWSDLHDLTERTATSKPQKDSPESTKKLLSCMLRAYEGIIWPNLSMDLIAAALGQRCFAREVTAVVCVFRPRSLEIASKRYNEFMKLLRASGEKVDQIMPLLTLDVNLFWRTHQLFPDYYRRWCEDHLQISGIAAAYCNVRRESSTRFAASMRLFRPLPVGWESRVDKRNRIYYIDHLKKATSWVHPRRLEIGQGVGSHLGTGPLPPGWEMRFDQESGRVYFVNHKKRETTWLDPRVLVARVEGDLPPGWEMRMDTQNRPYFVDHKNKRTTWEDPREMKETGLMSDGVSAKQFDENAGPLVVTMKEKVEHSVTEPLPSEEKLSDWELVETSLKSDDEKQRTGLMRLAYTQIVSRMMQGVASQDVELKHQLERLVTDLKAQKGNLNEMMEMLTKFPQPLPHLEADVDEAIKRSPVWCKDDYGQLLLEHIVTIARYESVFCNVFLEAVASYKKGMTDPDDAFRQFDRWVMLFTKSEKYHSNVDSLVKALQLHFPLMMARTKEDMKMQVEVLILEWRDKVEQEGELENEERALKKQEHEAVYRTIKKLEDMENVEKTSQI
jgi:hypothetical protein